MVLGEKLCGREGEKKEGEFKAQERERITFWEKAEDPHRGS